VQEAVGGAQATGAAGDSAGPEPAECFEKDGSSIRVTRTDARMRLICGQCMMRKRRIDECSGREWTKERTKRQIHETRELHKLKQRERACVRA
jgi:hypothetical protein